MFLKKMKSEADINEADELYIPSESVALGFIGTTRKQHEKHLSIAG